MQVPWSGVSTNHSTSPFAEEMYEKMKDNLIQYEVVINRWPQYSLVLENVSCISPGLHIKQLSALWSSWMYLHP